MRKTILALCAATLMGTAAGFGLGIFVYPFWFLNDVAMEEVAGRADREVLATGTFSHLNPSDPVHWGAGRVTLFADEGTGALVHLEADFAVGPGPRFHVYLSDRAQVVSRRDFQDGERLDLGRLKAFSGSQSYLVPAGTDAAHFASVVIWCKEFDVLITSAPLAEPSGPAQSGAPSA